MTIVTALSYAAPRSHGWSASFDWQDESDVCGYGESEADAVLDLIVKASEADDDGSATEEIADMAFSHWKAAREQTTIRSGPLEGA